MTNQDEIYTEISTTLDQTRKELLIISSSTILDTVTNYREFLNNCIKLSDKKAALRILVDSDNYNFMDKFQLVHDELDNADLLDIGFTEKLGKCNEMAMIPDSKYVIQIKYNGSDSKLIASFTNKEHQVLVQEILFEKYWNEVNSLATANP